MQVSLETVSNLERRLTVGVPAAQIDQEVDKRLAEAAKTVQLKGFRKGKVPLRVVRQRFGAGVRQEVLSAAISSSFEDALRQQSLRIAGRPRILPKQFEAGRDLEYVAEFEVYPEIDLQGISGVSVTRYQAEVTEADVEEMIETLRKSQAKWQQVDRPAAEGDRVVIDFVGRRNGEVFEGGSAQDQKLELGSNSMIPGFESGLIGLASGAQTTLDLTFPEDYRAEDLRGQAASFEVTVKAVEARELPELNSDFFRSFGVEESELEAFRREVRANMEREKDNIARNRLKQQTLDALHAANPISVPQSLVAGEIDALRQQALQQYGQQIAKLDPRALLPDELFRERAEKRTALGLLIAEIVSRNQIRVDGERVRTLVQSIASTYEDPESVVSYYYSNEQLLASAQAAVLEDQVVDHLLTEAQVVDKTVSYKELLKADESSAESGEEAAAEVSA